MKKIINEKKYDTNTATKVADYWNGYGASDFNYVSAVSYTHLDVYKRQEYGTSFFDKIVLDILNRNNVNYHMRIFDQLTQYTILPGTQDIPDPFYKKYLQPLSPMPIEFEDAYYELKKK